MVISRFRRYIHIQDQNKTDKKLWALILSLLTSTCVGNNFFDKIPPSLRSVINLAMFVNIFHSSSTFHLNVKITIHAIQVLNEELLIDVCKIVKIGILYRIVGGK